MKRPLIFLISLLFAAIVHGAPNYIEYQPIDRLVNTPVSNVKPGAKTLPLITWGGDIATIYANGSSTRTQAGSLFAQQGLDFRLQREDVFVEQVRQYLSGETAYLRGTMGMISAAADVVSRDERTKPVVFYQMTWSAGGDALVVKDGIKSAGDLRGKTIAVQAYGPHVDYLLRVLRDAGLSLGDVTIKWLPDLTGTDDSPASALYEADIDAAFVIIPDALALTSGGNVGTGAEDSVRGARILMSTRTANRVIADVYAVRSDYYQANKAEVESLASALVLAESQLSDLIGDRNARTREYKAVMEASAEILLDAKEAVADTEGLYADAEFVGLEGNLQFFHDNKHPRRFQAIVAEIAESLESNDLSSALVSSVDKSAIDYRRFSGAPKPGQAETQRFNQEQVSALVSRRQQQGTLDDGELYSFEVFFAPNQNTFSADLYQQEFDRVVELAATYGGAIITVEGHSDPMGYLRGKKGGEPSVVLSRIKQSAKNLSVSRAQEVRDQIISYANQNSISIDRSQFEPVGHGISQPATGICGDDPCAPANEQEWRSNMRVVFRLIQVEAEADVFKPL